MIRIKESTTKIFKRDFAYYLFGNSFVTMRLYIFTPMFFISILFYYLIKWDFDGSINQWCFWLSIFGLIAIWALYIYFIREWKLRKLGLSSKQLSDRVLWYNYESAIAQGTIDNEKCTDKVFMGNKKDIKLTKSLIKFYEPDVKAYKKRFVHKATIVTFIVGILTYILKDFIVIGLNSLFANQPKEWIIINGSLLFISGAIVILVYYFTINLIHKKQNVNTFIYEILCDLNIELKKKYKWVDSKKKKKSKK